MREIKTGLYTFAQILDACGIVVDESYDRRRIKVGGLSFDSLDEKLRVVGSELVVTLDDAVHTTFTITE